MLHADESVELWCGAEGVCPCASAVCTQKHRNTLCVCVSLEGPIKPLICTSCDKDR